MRQPNLALAFMFSYGISWFMLTSGFDMLGLGFQ